MVDDQAVTQLVAGGLGLYAIGVTFLAVKLLRVLFPSSQQGKASKWYGCER